MDKLPPHPVGDWVKKLPVTVHCSFSHTTQNQEEDMIPHPLIYRIHLNYGNSSS